MPSKIPISGRRSPAVLFRFMVLRNLDEEAIDIATDDVAAARLVRNTRYIVPYRVRGDAIEILRVFHTSRRLPKRRQPLFRRRAPAAKGAAARPKYLCSRKAVT